MRAGAMKDASVAQTHSASFRGRAPQRQTCEDAKVAHGYTGRAIGREHHDIAVWSVSDGVRSEAPPRERFFARIRRIALGNFNDFFHLHL
jgi:hypothetical protein